MPNLKEILFKLLMFDCLIFQFGLCRVGYSNSSLTLELNLIIGNVPLRRNLATLEGTVQPSAPLMPSPLDQSAPPHEDLRK